MIMKTQQLTGRRSAMRLQRGATLIFTLVALLILMAGSVAVVRSMNSNLNNAGNLAFRRDLINQGEEAVAKALATAFPIGPAASGANLVNANYSPVPLPANAQGIPLALLMSDADFRSFGAIGNDLVGSSSDVNIRYLVERLCSNGLETADSQGLQNCVAYTRDSGGGTASRAGMSGGSSLEPIYRVSARITGARNTQVFIQSSLAWPE